MDTRALRYFVSAYEEQSISGAAKRSYVAQPSVSTAIADLEAELGVPLFIRHPRGVTPTMEGQELYSAALQVLRGISAIARMFNEPRAPEPPLTLAVMPSIDVARLMQVLKFFTRRATSIDGITASVNGGSGALGSLNIRAMAEIPRRT